MPRRRPAVEPTEEEHRAAWRDRRTEEDLHELGDRVAEFLHYEAGFDEEWPA